MAKMIYRKYTKWITVLLFFTFSIQHTYASEKEIAAIIANDKRMQELDQSLNNNYAKLMKILPENKKKELKHEQRKWLKKRNALLHSLPALKTAYIERDEALYNLLKKKADEIEAILISGEEKINHHDKLAKISNCTLAACNAYRAYFLYKTNAPNAKEALAKVLEIEMNDPLLDDNINNVEVLSRLFVRESFSRDHDIPLWLIIENPQFLGELNGRFSPRVKSDYHIKELPAFSELQSHLDDMQAGHWRTVGSIVRDVAAYDENYRDFISFHPQGILEKHLSNEASTAKNLFPLLAWSYQGIWNRNSYLKFETLFDEAVRELKVYYQKHERIKDFSRYAEFLLSSYVHNCFPIVSSIASTPAFQIFHKPYLSIEALKEKTKDFSQKDWDQALSIAVLNHYSSETIEWMIQSGANVNAADFDETPLMKAIEQPLILALLLKHGAKVDQETPFGKTALFYAIQFNQAESVKLLIAAKANVNQQLKDLAAFIDLEWQDYQLKKVGNFTPYIYSLKYASPEITQYLLAMGADPKVLSTEQYEGWVSSTS